MPFADYVVRSRHITNQTFAQGSLYTHTTFAVNIKNVHISSQTDDSPPLLKLMSCWSLYRCYLNTDAYIQLAEVHIYIQYIYI